MNRWKKARGQKPQPAPSVSAAAEAYDRDTSRTEDDPQACARVAEWLTQYPASSPLVVVTVYNAYEDVIECVETLVTATAQDVPVLLIDDASTDGRLQQTLLPLAEAAGMLYLRKRTNRGIVDSANFAFAVSAPRDVVILNSDILLPVDWLPRLRAAAYSRSNIATVTPLTNNGVIYSVPYRNQPIEHFVKGMTLEQIDNRVRQVSARARPIVPTCITFCTYFRRTALDAVGPYDDLFSPGYGEEVDFSQRATTMGFNNIIADDLFVFHKGSRSFGTNERKRRIQDSHEAIVLQRYPWHLTQVQEIEHSAHDPLFMVIDRVRGGLLGSRIAIDATCINNEHVTGTQVGTVELIRALAVRPERTYTLTAIINDDLLPEAMKGIADLVDAVITVSALNRATSPSFDIVHRPYQVNNVEELQRLRRWAMRFIVSHLDCIAFSNPKYALNPEAWVAFRELTRLVFHFADGIAYISRDAAEDALHRGLAIPADRSEVVYFGVDHDLTVEPKRPAGHQRLTDRPFILMLGTNFLHKNRVFALRLLEALVARYDWPGNLVFAGPKVGSGSSGAAEAALKLGNRDLASRVIDVGNVTDAEKAWLLKHAGLVIYPSIYEGFGIVPFEAAAHGTPALSTHFTAVGEALGDEALFLESLDAEREAPVVWSLLSDPDVIAAQVAAIRTRAALYSWKIVAARVDDFYARIAAKPSRSRDIVDKTSDLHRHEYHYLQQEYARLEAWAKELADKYTQMEVWATDLDSRVKAMESKPFYGLLHKAGMV